MLLTPGEFEVELMLALQRTRSTSEPDSRTKFRRGPRIVAASVLSLTVGFWMTSPSGVLASTPANQTVTNLADTAATIVWDTPSAETGTVNYGTSCGALTLSGSSNTNPHAVDLSGLTSGTTYFYNIVSGG